jgi:hypothetical protein
MVSQESQEQEFEASQISVTMPGNLPAARNSGYSVLQAFILASLDIFNATETVAGSVSATLAGSLGPDPLLEGTIITGWKRARAQGTGIQLSGALYICWLLVPSGGVHACTCDASSTSLTGCTQQTITCKVCGRQTAAHNFYKRHRECIACQQAIRRVARTRNMTRADSKHAHIQALRKAT